MPDWPDIYVASSWRNSYQPAVVNMLRQNGFSVYDFHNPGSGNHGFHWSDIDPSWEKWPVGDFIRGLEHPLARKGYNTDKAALDNCKVVVLVLPCGRSAHLEFGYAVGQSKPGFILLDGSEPELMYKMATELCTGFFGLVQALKKTLIPRSSHERKQ